MLVVVSGLAGGGGTSSCDSCAVVFARLGICAILGKFGVELQATSRGGEAADLSVDSETDLPR